MCTCTHVVAVVNCRSCCYLTLLNYFAAITSIKQWRAAIESFRAVITYGRLMKHVDISIPAAYIFVLSALWCSFVVGIACVSKL